MKTQTLQSGVLCVSRLLRLPSSFTVAVFCSIQRAFDHPPPFSLSFSFSLYHPSLIPLSQSQSFPSTSSLLSLFSFLHLPSLSLSVSPFHLLSLSLPAFTPFLPFSQGLSLLHLPLSQISLSLSSPPPPPRTRDTNRDSFSCSRPTVVSNVALVHPLGSTR